MFYPNGYMFAAPPENGGWAKEMEAFLAEFMIVKGLRKLEEGQHSYAEGQRNTNANGTIASTSAYDVNLKEALYDEVVAAYLASDYLKKENLQAFNEYYFGLERRFPVEQDPNQPLKWFGPDEKEVERKGFNHFEQIDPTVQVRSYFLVFVPTV
eukprot:SAG31_NODE_2815_length_5045_cov_3.196522_8_plen_154_part_00